MKVLVVHNRYRSGVPSGENVSVGQEVKWLREAGVETQLIAPSNDEIRDAGVLRKAQYAAESVWSLSMQRRVADAIETARPDVLHVHNPFPLVTASVPWIANRRRVPVVWTVHNRRIACISGTNTRNGASCNLCHPGRRLPGVTHGCYRGSRAASLLMTTATSIYRSLSRHQMTAVAISRSVRDWLIHVVGYPPNRIRVKYNGVPIPAASDSIPKAADQRVILFAGRLSPAKGTPLVLQAWQRANLPDGSKLRIVGDGPLADQVAAAAQRDSRITWLHNVSAIEMPVHLQAARAVVVPSIWQEAFGRIAAEALSFGRPVIASGLGGLGEIVDEDLGWITGTSVDRLTRALEHATRDDSAIMQRSHAARLRHLERFTPEATTNQLLQIYESELDRSQNSAVKT